MENQIDASDVLIVVWVTALVVLTPFVYMTFTEAVTMHYNEEKAKVRAKPALALATLLGMALWLVDTIIDTNMLFTAPYWGTAVGAVALILVSWYVPMFVAYVQRVRDEEELADAEEQYAAGFAEAGNTPEE